MGRHSTVGRRGGGWWRRSDRCPSDQAHAAVDTQLEHLTVAPNSWVLGEQSVEVNAMLLEERCAAVALDNEVEFFAVRGGGKRLEELRQATAGKNDTAKADVK